jgi:hypothetical protein
VTGDERDTSIPPSNAVGASGAWCHAPASRSAQVPAPILAPYIGFVAVVLCVPGGGWLLLAPYALDLRHGAAHVPRAAIVELVTGAATVLLAIAAAVLFGMTLARRLRGEPPVPAADEPESEPSLTVENATEAEPPTRAGSVDADPGAALRDLLTPLVAALAADLRSHDAVYEPRRQEP